MVNSQSDATSSPENCSTVAGCYSKSNQQNSWTTAQSAKLYNIQGWGDPYFSIDEAGNIVVTPLGSQNQPIALVEIVNSLTKEGIDLPVLIRFPDILADRLARLHQCMERANRSVRLPRSLSGSVSN